jgi:hypothetical protein
MTASDTRLIRHLCIAIAVKLVLLAVIWWFFFRASDAHIDTDLAAAHVAGTSSGLGAKP